MKQFLVAVLCSIISLSTSEHYYKNLHYRNDCPCSDPELCKRITAPDRREVYAYGVNITYYKQYDWEKLTSIVIYEEWLEKYGFELVCLAHKHNARVLIATSISMDQLLNATARAEVVNYYFNLGQKYFMDGANVDVELQAKDPKVSEGLTSYVKETKEKWKAANPHSMVATDVWWIPNVYHDTWALANYSDFLFIMAYDEQADMHKPCVGRANAPYAQTQFGIAAFRALGIPGQKLVVGLPWYGYKYDCLNLTEKNLCYIKKDGNRCTEGVGSQLSYENVIKILPHSMGGRQWSDVYKSPFLNYKDTAGFHQIWFDDAESLKLKYALADRYDLRGVGMWNADCLDYANTTDPTTKEMWDALPSYK